MRVKSVESSVKSRKPMVALRLYSGSRLSTLDSRPPVGMTLIELLAVIVIITTIVAAAIPLLSPSNDDRRIREAARTLNTFFTGAQARAISLHRPVGVALKRLGADTNTDPLKKTDYTKNFHSDNGMCLEVYYVEQPVPYAGLDANSRACVAIHPTATGYVLVRFVTRGPITAGLPVGWSADLFPRGMIRQGDVIEIAGTQFQLLQPAGNMTIDPVTQCFEPGSGVAMILARPLNDSGQQINPKYDDQGREIGSVVQAQPPYWTSPAPYQVLRQPAAMSDEPYQLPEGTAIDLRASGVGDTDFFHVTGVNDNDQGVVIMFSPEGRVSRVAYYHTYPPQSAPFDQPVNDNIYLLIGRSDKVPPAVSADPTLKSPIPTDPDALAKLKEPINWLSGNSRWIVIGSQSGRIATIENGAVDLASTLVAPPKPFNTAAPSTEEMRCAQIITAREHTQEVGQLGGR